MLNAPSAHALSCSRNSSASLTTFLFALPYGLGANTLSHTTDGSPMRLVSTILRRSARVVPLFASASSSDINACGRPAHAFATVLQISCRSHVSFLGSGRNRKAAT